jgi:iron complex transport system substrate-binding protein
LGSILLSAVVGAGCSPGPSFEPGRDVVDGLGRRLRIPERPRRIVSLAPSVTDILFSLGFGDRVVGVSNFCAPPDGAGAVARVGGILNPSLEVIRQLDPDLLVATTSGNDPGLASQAEALGLPLYAVHAGNVEGVLQAIVALADALGDPASGERLAADLRDRLETIRQRLAGEPPTRVLYVVWSDPLIVPGRPAFLTDAIHYAGATLVTEDAPGAWPTYSLEAVIASSPEVILTSPQNLGLAERLPREPAWSDVPAVRAGRIHVVGAVIEQPGPSVVRGIEEVARLLHPDRFPGPSSAEQEE